MLDVIWQANNNAMFLEQFTIANQQPPSISCPCCDSLVVDPSMALETVGTYFWMTNWFKKFIDVFVSAKSILADNANLSAIIRTNRNLKKNPIFLFENILDEFGFLVKF